jgi:hypothetical protein
MSWMNPFRLFATVCLLTFLTGCATFDHDYQMAIAKDVLTKGVEGAWEGRWESQAGHGGDQLRAIVTKTGPGTWHARFLATYDSVLQINEDVDLHAVNPEAAVLHATGEADLGWFKGGVYKYDATITPGQFDATYTSDHDHGTFNLKRPK